MFLPPNAGYVFLHKQEIFLDTEKSSMVHKNIQEKLQVSDLKSSLDILIDVHQISACKNWHTYKYNIQGDPKFPGWFAILKRKPFFEKLYIRLSRIFTLLSYGHFDYDL